MTTLPALVDYGDSDRDELFDNHTADLAVVRGWCDCADPAHPIVIVRATVNPADPAGSYPRDFDLRMGLEEAEQLACELLRSVEAARENDPGMRARPLGPDRLQ